MRYANYLLTGRELRGPPFPVTDSHVASTSLIFTFIVCTVTRLFASYQQLLNINMNTCRVEFVLQFVGRLAP